MKPKTLIMALALGSLVFAILMPPEAYPSGKMAVIVCGTFAFLAALIERQVPSRYLVAGLTIFSLLLVHSLFLSVDSYRSLEFMTLLWAYYCLLGFFMYSGEGLLKPTAATIVGLSAIVSLYGLYQYFFGFDQLYQFIAYSGSNDVVKVPALDRVATRRVFSTLALPGTLWGFLVIALPFHAVLWRRNRVLDVLLTASAALLLTTGFLTRSFGFLVGLLIVVVGWLFLQHRRIVWNRLSIVLMLLAIVGGTFYSARQEFIESSNPLSLRFLNWVSAWHIFAANPAGTGLNTYGVAYPHYMLPGANETQYAHNTFLQFLSELGYPAVLAGVALLVFLAGRGRPNLSDKSTGYVFLALIAWLLHNAIDINVYFGSLGVVGAVTIGLLCSGNVIGHIAPARSLLAGAAVFTSAAVGFGALVFTSDELRHRAQIEYENNKTLVAIATLEQARAVMPFNSSVYHESGEILLDASQKLKDTKYLDRATESFRRAIELSPNKVGPHIGLGLCLSQAGNLDGAISELDIAHDLYPRSTYVQAITRLLEARK